MKIGFIFKHGGAIIFGKSFRFKTKNIYGKRKNKIIIPITASIVTSVIVVTIIYWKESSANLNSSIGGFNKPLIDLYGKNDKGPVPKQNSGQNLTNSYPYLPPPQKVQREQDPGDQFEMANFRNTQNPDNMNDGGGISPFTNSPQPDNVNELGQFHNQTTPSNQIGNNICICPNCLTVITKPPGTPCFTQSCPQCGTKLIERNILPTNQQANTGNQANAKTIAITQQTPYYENQIDAIIMRDCSRCHSGPSRNLMTYDNLAGYARSGILGMMVGPGGPMSKFAGNDGTTIMNWINAGSPEKFEAVQAAFNRMGNGGGRFCVPPQMGVQNQNQNFSMQNGIVTQDFTLKPGEETTYENSIKWIIAKDCSRCHSGQMRNLMTYKNVKYYVDNGLLFSLVSPGGQMHRFSGPDTDFIISWINSGAPR